MRCIGCGEPMVVLEILDVEVDHCLECGGTWLDGGELKLLLEGSGRRDELLASLADAGPTGEKKRKCPICSKRMDKVLIGSEERIIIDRCPARDGLWFDRGELMKVLRMGAFPPELKVYEILSEIFSKKE